MATAKKKVSVSKGLVPLGAGHTHLPALNDPRLREIAAQGLKRARPASGGSKVSIRGRRFKAGGQDLGTEIRVSIIEWGYIHAFYQDAFNEQAPTPPVCFSLSLEPSGAVPHAMAPDHLHTDCDSCPNNVFGSATTGSGKGKACKDSTRLTVVFEKDLDSADSANGATVWTLDVPATSLAAWDKYSGDIQRKFMVPPLAIVTEISFAEGLAYPSLVFSPAAGLGDEAVVSALLDRREEAAKQVLQPWQPLGEGKPKAAATGRGAAVRGAVKGKKSTFG